jgi:hypothetical protein
MTLRVHHEVTGDNYYLDRPLEWENDLTDFERREVLAISKAQLPVVLPQVLFGDGVVPAAQETYPNRSAVAARCAAIAVERAVTLLTPTRAATLKVLYKDAPEHVLGSREYAAEVGIKVERGYDHVCRANIDLSGGIKRVVEGKVDWSKGPDSPRLTIVRYNALQFLSNLGVPVPDLASLSDAREIALQRLDAALTLSREEKGIVADLYHLGGLDVQSVRELGARYGYSKGAIMNVANSAVRRLTTVRHESNADGNNLAPLPSDPIQALRMMRQASRNGSVIVSAGSERGYVEHYTKYLHTEFVGRHIHKEVLQGLRTYPYDVIKSGYNLISRYCDASGDVVENSLTRDMAILEQYMRDVRALEELGIPQPEHIGRYLSAQDVMAVYTANPDIPHHYINLAIRSNRADPEHAVADFRHNVEIARLFLLIAVTLQLA